MQRGAHGDPLGGGHGGWRAAFLGKGEEERLWEREGSGVGRGQLGQGVGQGLVEAASGGLGAECLSSSDGRESGACACSMEQQVSGGAGDHGSSGACLMGHHGRAASRRGVRAQRRCNSDSVALCSALECRE